MRIATITFTLLLAMACTSEPVIRDFDLQGHRGARGLLPENTIPGFLIAVDHGVDTIEFDIVVTADDQILISHEPWFHHQISTRPDGTPVTEEEQQEINIYEMTYEETLQFDVGLRGHPNFPEQEPLAANKPLMRDAIIAVEAYVAENGLTPVRYSIETKSRADWYDHFVPRPGVFARLVYDELSELGVLERVIIQSFDPETLIALREIDPDIKQAILVSADIPIVDLVEYMGYTPEIWSPHYQLVTPRIVQEAHERSMKVIPWTINDPREMRRQLEMGVDGIITDYPDRAARLKPLP